MKPQRRSVVVDLPTRTVLAEFRYWTARQAAHAGADSPRFLSPGIRARIDELRIYDEHRCEVTDLPYVTLGLIRTALLELARQGILRVRVQPTFLDSPFSREPRRRSHKGGGLKTQRRI